MCAKESSASFDSEKHSKEPPKLLQCCASSDSADKPSHWEDGSQTSGGLITSHSQHKPKYRRAKSECNHHKAQNNQSPTRTGTRKPPSTSSGGMDSTAEHSSTQKECSLPMSKRSSHSPRRRHVGRSSSSGPSSASGKSLKDRPSTSPTEISVSPNNASQRLIKKPPAIVRSTSDCSNKVCDPHDGCKMARRANRSNSGTVQDRKRSTPRSRPSASSPERQRGNAGKVDPCTLDEVEFKEALQRESAKRGEYETEQALDPPLASVSCLRGVQTGKRCMAIAETSRRVQRSSDAPNPPAFRSRSKEVEPQKSMRSKSKGTSGEQGEGTCHKEVRRREKRSPDPQASSNRRRRDLQRAEAEGDTPPARRDLLLVNNEAQDDPAKRPVAARCGRPALPRGNSMKCDRRAVVARSRSERLCSRSVVREQYKAAINRHKDLLSCSDEDNIATPDDEDKDEPNDSTPESEADQAEDEKKRSSSKKSAFLLSAAMKVAMNVGKTAAKTTVGGVQMAAALTGSLHESLLADGTDSAKKSQYGYGTHWLGSGPMDDLDSFEFSTEDTDESHRKEPRHMNVVAKLA